MDEMGAELAMMADSRRGAGLTRSSLESLNRLNAYYKHQADLLRGFEKDQKKLDAGLKAIQSWIDGVQALVDSAGPDDGVQPKA